MRAQVHVWEGLACIFNVAFYRNEGNKECAGIMMCVLWNTSTEPYTSEHAFI